MELDQKTCNQLVIVLGSVVSLLNRTTETARYESAIQAAGELIEQLDYEAEKIMNKKYLPEDIS